ncbi:FHA domain-containing protein [Catenulispora rubra]|uniref:FHA domain-containing protein n=1 Tax=Catenulispora rubra TaxID=280293 RepID=UPI0018923C8B|nr:FHA domain-containing protein [Catenulispora rubra]
MMATCPDGHQSVATDYCDECGLSMGAPLAAPGNSAPAGGPAGHGSPSAPSYGAAGEPCPKCLMPRQDGDTFCEGCGFPFDEEQNSDTIDEPELDIEAELRKAEKAQRAAEEAAREAAARTGGQGGQGGQIGQIGQGGPSGPVVQGFANGVNQGTLTDPGSGSGRTGSTGQVGQGSQGGQNGQGSQGGPANQGSQVGPDSDPLAQTVTSDPGGAVTAVQWIAIASADRAYYDAVVAEGEIDANAYPFPPYCPDRQFELKGDTVRIGRSGKRGNVDIDLTGPPTDPGVSHLHAVFQHRPDGGWQVVDLGSMNGTVLNDDTAPIPANQAFPVEAGYRIHVGVWTTLTLIQLA